MRYILIRYSEIALKGKNRAWFENILKENVQQKISSIVKNDFKLQRIAGRIKLSFSQNIKTFQQNKINQALQHIFGIANFSWAQKEDLDLEKISQSCWQMIKEKKFTTFRITSQRSNKKFPFTSEEINQQVGASIFEKLEKLKKNPRVQLKNPDLECFIEISDKEAFLYTEKIKGLGGLPVGVSGKALVLLSGGIDSPIAAYYALKRGVKTDFIHFHALPYTKADAIKKVISLAQILNRYQISSRLFLVPLAEIQNVIVKKSPEKYRLLFYRRAMMQLADQLAQKNNYQALYTGEAVGQVASQTLENIQTTNQASQTLVLRPLIGFDKEEIIAQAQKIGTYPISILPHEDTCTRFVPQRPATKARLDILEKIEKSFHLQKLFDNAIKKTEIKTI